MTKTPINTETKISGAAYRYILELYDKVIEKCKSDDVYILYLYVCFKDDVAEQIKRNIECGSGTEYGWLKIVCLTNFNEFVESAEKFIND